MAENTFECCTPSKPVKPCDSSEESICSSCGCVGYGFVPIQELSEVYDTKTALCNGTIFPELNLDICEYGKVCKQLGGAVCE